MNALVALILIGALGLLFGRFLFLRPRPGSWLDRFFLSGAEFLVLGALIGPHGFGVLDLTALLKLEPFVVLALSWVGLLLGVQLRFRYLARFPFRYFQVAFLESTVALLAAFALMGLVFSIWTPVGAGMLDRWRAALCLGAVAALSSPTEAALHNPGVSHAGHAAGLLRFVPAVDPLVALAGLAALFGFWHVSLQSPGALLGAWGWIAASVGGGAVLGAAFLLLLRPARDPDEVVLVVLGMALFSGGLASVFHLSPLVVCLVEGLVIGNWRQEEGRLIHMFLRLERPLYIALLVLAGAAWRFDEPWGYVLAGMFLAVRVAAKFLGTRIALTLTPLPFRPPERWWLGLLPQGAMAVALAVSYFVVYRDPLAERVFSAVLVSTVLLTLVSGRLVQRALETDSEGPAQ